MTTYLLEVPVDAANKEVVTFEVDRAEASGDLTLASPEPGKVVVKAQVTLEEALATLKSPMQKIVHLLKELSPDETELEFGLKIGGETGIIVARGTAEVHFVVRLSWKPEQPH